MTTIYFLKGVLGKTVLFYKDYIVWHVQEYVITTANKIRLCQWYFNAKFHTVQNYLLHLLFF